MIFAMHDPLADLLGEWSRGLNTGSVLLRIALAVLLASVIGCERSSKRHSAGLRTFVLVSFASTVSMLLDVYLMSNFGARLPILSAATVIAAALVSGNAILFSSRSQIKGLTTSTGLWACSILGFAIGAGLYTVTPTLAGSSGRPTNRSSCSARRPWASGRSRSSEAKTRDAPFANSAFICSSQRASACSSPAAGA